MSADTINTQWVLGSKLLMGADGDPRLKHPFHIAWALTTCLAKRNVFDGRAKERIAAEKRLRSLQVVFFGRSASLGA